MGYTFKINPLWYRIREDKKEYPWPCLSDVERKILIFNDDVLKRHEGNTYIKHTGLCCFNIIIPEQDLIEQTEPIELVLL